MKIETDPIFSDPRLVALYDAFENTRHDLIHYVNIVRELNAKNVIDLGCGTGSLSVLLAAEQIRVMAVDPAEASVAAALTKKDSDKVEWIVGDASVLPTNVADAVVMVGNVVQAIVEPHQWQITLQKIHSALKPGGHVIFETRVLKRWPGQNGTGTTRFRAL